MAETRSISLERLLTLLAEGKVELEGQFVWSSNYTFLVKVSDDEMAAAAVYKPCAGERPLWDFDQATLCQREVATYLLSAQLGWPAVPPTVLRDGPHGPGSVQLYVDASHEETFFSLRETGKYDPVWQQIAAFDALVNNADRKGGHCLQGKDGTIWAIDHGLTFHAEPKLRTVIWDYAGQRLPTSLLDDLQALAGRLAPDQPLWRALEQLLAPAEMEALAQRLARLLDSGRFPQPGPGRNVPYPLV